MGIVHRTLRRRRLNRTPWQPRRRLSRVPSARPLTSSRRSTPCRAVSSSAPAWSDARSWRRRSPALRHLASLGERKSSLLRRLPLHWRLSGWAAPQGCALQVPQGWRAALGTPGERPSRCAASGSHMVPPSACAHPPCAPTLCTHPVHPVHPVRPGSSTRSSRCCSRCSSWRSPCASTSAATARALC